jgi:DMSO/TMAO reductase YedYZ molybdopterin-dependent catalytic subunit
MNPDTLLANEMNGEPLSVEHGAPLRLIVPGWYGMASVKWLRKITVLDHKYEGFFQTDRYVVPGDDGNPVPVSNIAVKSLISWPQQGESLRMDTYNVVGLAWSGHAHIRKVEFSDDGGESWQEAELVGPRYRYAWQQWNFAWNPKRTGHHNIVARAEDEEGNLQPLESKWNRLGYMINGVKPVCVTVTE